MDLDDQEESAFEICREEVDGISTGKVFALDDIPTGSYIMPTDLVSSFSTSEEVLDNLKVNTEIPKTGHVSVLDLIHLKLT